MGKLFTVTPAFPVFCLKDDDIFFDENILNHESFISTLDGLLENKILNKKDYSLEESFIKSLSKNKIIKNNLSNLNSKSNIIIKKDFKRDFKYKLENEIKFCDYKLQNINLEKLKTFSYNDFGLYIIKSEEFFLSFMIGPIGQKGNGGHGHLDKLSFELNVPSSSLPRLARLLVDPHSSPGKENQPGWHHGGEDLSRESGKD